MQLGKKSKIEYALNLFQNNTELFDNITTFILFGLLLVIFIINMFAEPRKVEKVVF